MTYSVEALIFRAVGCAVNTAARAANGVLEIMYPKDLPAARLAGSSSGTAAHGADPARAADPEAGVAPPAPVSGSLDLPWEVIDLTDPPYADGLDGFPWGIADRWGVIIGRFDTEDQAYAVVEAVSDNTLAGGPLLW